MKLIKIIAYPAVFFSFSGCIPEVHTYYVSPINQLNNHYTTIPLQRDSLKSAYYINGLITAGDANDRGHDNTLSFQTYAAASYNLKHVQAYCGAGMVLGQYTIKPYSFGSPTLNQYAGKSFFGAVGVNGGLNLVASFPMGGEIRLGIEGSVYKEYGNYLNIRKQLPDSVTTYINRKNSFGTLGAHIELVTRMRHGALALKTSVGTGNPFRHAEGISNYTYVDLTIAQSFGKWTPYLQANIATKATDGLFGINYQLGK